LLVAAGGRHREREAATGRHFDPIQVLEREGAAAEGLIEEVSEFVMIAVEDRELLGWSKFIGHRHIVLSARRRPRHRVTWGAIGPRGAGRAATAPCGAHGAAPGAPLDLTRAMRRGFRCRPRFLEAAARVLTRRGGSISAHGSRRPPDQPGPEPGLELA